MRIISCSGVINFVAARNASKIAPRIYCLFRVISGSAHRVRETVDLLTKETPDFIPPKLWLPNSPDLNPVDYKVWSVMQEKVYKERIIDVDELRSRILAAWDELDQRVIDMAIKQWRTCLHVYVKAQGGHFERKLSQ